MYTHKEKNARDCSLDLIRSVAIALVVLNHSIEMYFPLNRFNELDIVDNTKIFFFLLFTFARCGVPLFLFLTGFLLLHRDYSEASSYVLFLKKNLFPILITWEIWILIYNYIHAYGPFGTNILNYSFIIEEILLVRNAPMIHSWYVPMIIGLYIFIPLVSMVLKTISTKNILFIISILYGYFFILPTINICLDLFGVERIYRAIDLSFSGGCYGLYLLIGYLFYHKYNNSNSSKLEIPKKIIFIAYVFFILLTVYFQYYIYKNNKCYFVWYDFIAMPINGYLLFELLKQAKIINKLKPIFRSISSCAFGIYLIHLPIQLYYTKYCGNRFSCREISVFFVFVASFFVSYIIVMSSSFSKNVGFILFRKK